jgi:hypothetical protein
MSNIDYEVALARLRASKAITIPGGDDFQSVRVTRQLTDTIVVMFDQDGQFIMMSPEMLQEAAKWVERETRL